MNLIETSLTKGKQDSVTFYACKLYTVTINHVLTIFSVVEEIEALKAILFTELDIVYSPR